MSSGGSISSKRDKHLWIQINSSVRQLVQRDHVAMAPPIVKRRQAEDVQPFSVRQVLDLWYQLGGLSLDFFHLLLVCLVEFFKEKINVAIAK